MRLAVLSSLAVLAALGLLAGCGRGSSAVGAVATANNPEGLQATFTVTRADDRWFIGQLHLKNDGAKAIAFKNAAGETVSGFRLVAGESAAIPAQAGLWAKSGAARLMELPAGTIADMEVKWKFAVPPSPRKNYGWTVTITNLSADGKPAGDVVLKKP